MQDRIESNMPVNLQINGIHLQAEEGQTVLDVARKSGIHIPTLCYHPALKPSGSCRLCAVEVENASGRHMILLSCVLKAKEGMMVNTQNEAVQQARFKAFERLIQMAPQSRRLHELAERENIPLPPAPDGCIRCRLCVRVCKEIVGQEALRMEKHGGRLQVVPVAGKCIGCGTCANLCPTHVIRIEDKGPLRTISIRDEIIGQHSLERCEGCGKYYATEKHVHLAEERTGPHPQVKVQHHYCTACAKLFSDRLQFVQKHPPRVRFDR
jgi:predicted molibdopterin-dependent oxidoreductase YjgC